MTEKTIATNSLVISINKPEKNADNIDMSLDDLALIFKEGFEKMGVHFGRANKRFDQIDRHFDRVGACFDKIEKHLDVLERGQKDIILKLDFKNHLSKKIKMNLN